MGRGHSKGCSISSGVMEVFPNSSYAENLANLPYLQRDANVNFGKVKNENIGLTIPGNWSFEIRRISAGEIHQISGEIHTKSAQNPPDFMNVSFWVITKYRSFFRKTKQC